MNQLAARVNRRLDAMEEAISTGRRSSAATSQSAQVSDANRAMKDVGNAFSAVHEAAHDAFNDLVQECGEADSAQ